MDFFTSLNIPLIVLAIVIFAFWILAFIIIYHLTRFGVGRAPKVISFIFFVVSLIIMLVIFSKYLILFHV